MKMRFVGLVTLVSVFFGMFTVVSHAETDSKILSEIGDFEVDYSGGFGIDYIHEGKTKILYESHFTDAETDYLLEVFSDKSLVASANQPKEMIDRESLPSVGSFDIQTMDYRNLVFYFDESKVVMIDTRILKISEPPLVYQGLYEYRNPDIYTDFIDFLNNKCKQLFINGGIQAPEDEKIPGEAETPKEEESEKALGNPVKIEDFEIIYSAELQRDFNYYSYDWGICSYIKDGTNTVRGYVKIYDGKDGIIYSMSSPISENSFSFDNKRYVKINSGTNDGVEYDATRNVTFTPVFAVNIDSAMKIETLLMVIDGDEHYVNADDLVQKGSLPGKQFSAAYNTDYANKVEDFDIKTSMSYKKTNTVNGTYDNEWGFCTYSTRRDGKVTAVYLYDPQWDVYYIEKADEIKSNEDYSYVFGANAIENMWTIDDWGKGANRYKLTFNADETGIVTRWSLYDYSSRSIVPTKIYGNNMDLSTLDIFACQSKEQTDCYLQKEDAPKNLLNSETNVNEDKKAEIAADEPAEKADENNNIVNTAEFVDVPQTHWAYEAIKYFSSENIVLGYGNGYFGTNDMITNYQLSLLLDRIFDYDSENTTDAYATREDFIVSVVKAAGLSVDSVDTDILNKRFSDCRNVSDDSKKYLAVAVENGIVEGYNGKLFPQSMLTRAEAVAILYRL